MEVKIKDKTITLNYTSRMYYIYEEKFQENVEFENLRSQKQQMNLFYACILASIQKQKLDISFSQDEFTDWLDDNGDIFLVSEFMLLFSNECTTRSALVGQKEEADDGLPKQRKKSKG